MSKDGEPEFIAVVLPGESFDASPPGAKEHRVGVPLVRKIYDLPASVSTYEFMVVYRDALTGAEWTVIRTAASSDTLVVAHYAKNGRDIFCYLHGDTYSVADVGATNEAKRLADALAREGHVAIYALRSPSGRPPCRSARCGPGT